jgi:4-hydroxybenzoate polyprenyltransferase
VAARPRQPLTALLLVLQLNWLTIELAVIGAAVTITYPLFKRFFPLPQLYLGLCFGWPCRWRLPRPWESCHVSAG